MDPGQFSIRKALPADDAQIAQVEVDTWRATYRGIVSDAAVEGQSAPERTAYWLDELAKYAESGRRMLVAEAAGPKIVGFASAGPSRWADFPQQGELYGLYVLPGWQRGGVGRRLLAAVARELAGAGLASLMLWVLTANPYRRFYEQLGAELLAERPLNIRGELLAASAYGWNDLGRLTAGS